MIFGVGNEVANVVFHAVVSKIKAGEQINDGDVLVNVLNLACTVRQVTGEAANPYALNAIRRYEGSAQKIGFPAARVPRSGKCSSLGAWL